MILNFLPLSKNVFNKKCYSDQISKIFFFIASVAASSIEVSKLNNKFTSSSLIFVKRYAYLAVPAILNCLICSFPFFVFIFFYYFVYQQLIVLIKMKIAQFEIISQFNLPCQMPFTIKFRFLF